MEKSEFEIERKFLIRMPDLKLLDSLGDKSGIIQTYLKSDSGTARVRKRGREGEYVYTHTEKKRLSDMRRIEHEREIGESEYHQLLEKADRSMQTIEKVRYCVDYMGQMLEIDIFPFYADRAILEIELENEVQAIHIPPWLDIIREVTSDRRYTNAAMAKSVPMDEI